MARAKARRSACPSHQELIDCRRLHCLICSYASENEASVTQHYWDAHAELPFWRRLLSAIAKR